MRGRLNQQVYRAARAVVKDEHEIEDVMQLSASLAELAPDMRH